MLKHPMVAQQYSICIIVQLEVAYYTVKQNEPIITTTFFI